MRWSKSTQYAIQAVGHIARATEDKVVRADDIARESQIPVDYLLKIMQQLAKAGVLVSKRGPRGGFWLAKPAAKITLLEIIEAVDGPIVTEFPSVDPLTDAAYRVLGCGMVAVRAKLARTKLPSLL